MFVIVHSPLVVYAYDREYNVSVIAPISAFFFPDPLPRNRSSHPPRALPEMFKHTSTKPSLPENCEEMGMVKVPPGLITPAKRTGTPPVSELILLFYEVKTELVPFGYKFPTRKEVKK